MEAGVQLIVGVSEMAISTSPDDVFVTYSLGSCVGLSLFDPVARVGGMLHAMLPLSSLDASRATANPAMFTDSGVSALLQGLFDKGATRRDLVAVVAGAASQLDSHKLFRIGERNYTVLRRLLWKNEILIAAEDVGGAISRTMYLEMATGRTLVKAEGRTRVLGGNGKKGDGRARCAGR
jgi:chemotaxis protein CheD